MREPRRRPGNHHPPRPEHPEDRRPGDGPEREHHLRPEQLELPPEPRASSGPARPGAAHFPDGAHRADSVTQTARSTRPSSRDSLRGWFASPARYSAAYRKSPDRSPVKTRPVRFPPCAAGASPTMASRARGSPHPGTGRAQYVQSRKARRFTRPTSSRQRTSRGTGDARRDAPLELLERVETGRDHRRSGRDPRRPASPDHGAHRRPPGARTVRRSEAIAAAVTASPRQPAAPAWLRPAGWPR